MSAVASFGASSSPGTSAGVGRRATLGWLLGVREPAASGCGGTQTASGGAKGSGPPLARLQSSSILLSYLRPPKKDSGAAGGPLGGFVGGAGQQHQVQQPPSLGGGGLGVGGGGAMVGGGGGVPPLVVSEKPSKEEEESLWSNVEAQAAFLGPNLWDRTLPYDADLKEYVDLDEFLSENGIPVEGGVASSSPAEQHQAAPGGHAMAPRTPPHHQQHQGQASSQSGGEPPPQQPQPEVVVHRRRPPSRSPRPESYDGGDERHYPSPQSPLLHPIQDNVVKMEHSRSRMLRCSPQPPMSSAPNPSPPDADSLALLSGCAAGPPSPAGSDFSMSSSTTTTTGHDFDPRTRAFSDEELKPQPMIKKSKKQFVPDDLKDEKYWARRRKNNMAAKRSRDARRVKENQIALRAGFLEKENIGLRQELERLKKENSVLRDRLTKYTDA